MKKLRRYFRLLPLVSLYLLLNACTMAYKSTGDVLINYVEDQGVPYLLASHDVGMSCSMAETFAPFLLSFEQVTTPPDHLAILFYLMASHCVEVKAWDEELRYLRAIHQKKPIEAQDARIAQQRFLAQAAARQLTGYQHLTKAIAEPGGAECPQFSADSDEFYWLIGLINGIQAVMNDISSGGSLGVPMNIAAKVGRGAACLDNQKWWGVPGAIQAAIGLIIPADQNQNTVFLEILNNALQTGIEQGISVTQVLAAHVYLGQGKIQKIKHIIHNYSQQFNKITPTNQQFKILNQVSKLQLQAISDRLWTEATGHRTPLGKLGTFWDDPKPVVDMIDIDAIL